MELVRIPVGGVYYNFYDAAGLAELVEVLNGAIRIRALREACASRQSDIHDMGVALQRRIIRLGSPPTLNGVRLTGELGRLVNGGALLYDDAVRVSQLLGAIDRYAADGCVEGAADAPEESGSGVVRRTGEVTYGMATQPAAKSHSAALPIFMQFQKTDPGASAPADDMGDVYDGVEGDENTQETTAGGLSTNAKLALGLVGLGALVLVVKLAR